MAEGELGTISAAFTNSTDVLITASVNSVQRIGGESRDEFIPTQTGRDARAPMERGRGELIFKRLILVTFVINTNYRRKEIPAASWFSTRRVSRNTNIRNRIRA